MEVYVKDTKNNILDIVNRYSSLIWAKRYNTFGDWEIAIPAKDTDLSLFKKGTFISRSDDDMMGLIEKTVLQTTEEGEQVIISGRDSRALLNRRVDIGQRNVVDKSLEEHIKALINENFYNVGNRSLSSSTAYSFTTTNIVVTEQTENIVIGDYISELCKKYGYGFKFIAFEAYFSFALFGGTDRRNQIFFSKNRDNLLSSSYTEDKTSFANVIISQDESNGPKCIITLDNNASGFNRFETVGDSETSSTADLTQTEVAELWPGGQWAGANGLYYYNRSDGLVAMYSTNNGKVEMTLMGDFYKAFMKSKAESILNEKGVVTTLNPTVAPNVTHKYKQDYFVGDIVGIKDTFGAYPVRVSGAVESWDQNGYNLDLELETVG